MKKIWNFILFSIMLSFVFMPGISAQEEETNEVCLVYFTSHDCGDDCGLTDTFMDGLMSEYAGNLISITYYIDTSQDNQNVFRIYRNTYGLPQDVPIVLFGKNDYLQGITNIYENTETRIFSFLQMNGTNCPLDSGYVPPSQIDSANLPGQPQVRISGANATETGGEREGLLPENGGDSGASGQNPLLEFFTVGAPITENLLSMIIIAAALIAVGIIVFFIWERSQESP